MAFIRIFSILIFLLCFVALIFVEDSRDIQVQSIAAQQQATLGMQDQNKQIVIGWIPYWDQDKAFKSFSSHADKFDYISVFWYVLDPKGKVKLYDGAEDDQEIIDFAHANNVKVTAIVANLADTDNADEIWDVKRVNRVLATHYSRKKHISDLVKIVEKKNLDGIDIDYEALKQSQQGNFSKFIEELADELHKRNKVLGVAIHPKTEAHNPDEDNGAHAQDLKRISRAADHLYFMTYLENGTFSQPGPLGSLDWIKNVMTYALNEVTVDPAKTFMGIGLTGAEWKRIDDGTYTGVRSDVLFEEVLAIVNKTGAKVNWDNVSQTPYIEYNKENKETHMIWYENAVSVAERVKLAKELGVGGIAFWRLGGEDTSMWNKIGD